ncbi:MAG: tRNA preQ1(34) S-adenosylmethionine ribosyltransferase-isomerase QueA [Alphaproteobacteria bacterium]|nr:tRNA preQ1(34) S-adenosylmethionine ribosyltransferase-isomerase QueA [Alphaproteobacteria bacterium]
MKVDAFDFDLPPGLVAARPAVPRDAARLLEVTQNGVRDRGLRELPGLFSSGDILVVNDTRVIPARLTGRRGMARVEVTLHQAESLDTWRAFARPARRLRPGESIEFDPELTAEVMARGEGGEVTLRFDRGGADLMAALQRLGTMPLPPYMKRPGDERDRQDYQTLFATHDGAVAAPTAGLHFTPELVAALAARGVDLVAVTLHVGAGTFLPVKVEDTRDHKMHSEFGIITPAVAEAINAARAAGGRVVAVGTTSLRLLETATDESGQLHPFRGETAIFITPGYRFRGVDGLLTNFHLPRSTLFMLVCAFAGMERMTAAYRHAIGAGYRFYSYGDACLLRRG